MFDKCEEIICVLSNRFNVYKPRPPFPRVLSDGIGVASSTKNKTKK